MIFFVLYWCFSSVGLKVPSFFQLLVRSARRLSLVSGWSSRFVSCVSVPFSCSGVTIVSVCLTISFTDRQLSLALLAGMSCVEATCKVIVFLSHFTWKETFRRHHMYVQLCLRKPGTSVNLDKYLTISETPAFVLPIRDMWLKPWINLYFTLDHLPVFTFSTFFS